MRIRIWIQEDFLNADPDPALFRSETVFKANVFSAKLPKRNAFLEKRSETCKAKLSETFLWFREAEAKRSETVSVSLSFALKRNFCIVKLGHPSGDWDEGDVYLGKIQT